MIDKFCEKCLCPIFQRSLMYGQTHTENSSLKNELNDINNKLNDIVMILNRTLKDANLTTKYNSNFIPNSSSSNIVERKDGRGIDHSYIFIEPLSEYIPVECSFCSNFQKVDIETLILTKDSIEVLSK